MALIFSDHLIGAKDSEDVQYVIYFNKPDGVEAPIHGVSSQIAVDCITSCNQYKTALKRITLPIYVNFIKEKVEVYILLLNMYANIYLMVQLKETLETSSY